MTFISPFDEFGDKAKIEAVEWELWTGSFGCHEKDCWEVSHEAKYDPESKLLTWKCPQGHISKIEDYK